MDKILIENEKKKKKRNGSCYLPVCGCMTPTFLCTLLEKCCFLIYEFSLMLAVLFI